MKTQYAILAIVMFAASSCSGPADQTAAATTVTEVGAGQSSVQDDESQKNIVQTAIASPDHKTLVAALQAA